MLMTKNVKAEQDQEKYYSAHHKLCSNCPPSADSLKAVCVIHRLPHRKHATALQTICFHQSLLRNALPRINTKCYRTVLAAPVELSQCCPTT